MPLSIYEGIDGGGGGGEGGEGAEGGEIERGGEIKGEEGVTNVRVGERKEVK